MGFKFKKFRGTLRSKSKNPAPEIVCLKYQINSEFENISTPIPTTSTDVASRLKANDVVKQKKLPSKPAIQSLFEDGPPTTSPAKVHLNNVDDKATTDDCLNTEENKISPPETPKPKSILKKFNPDENLIGETAVLSDHIPNNENTEDTDDCRKSALIFMTENHDYIDENYTSNNIDETSKGRTVFNSINGKTNEQNIQNNDNKTKDEQEANNSSLSIEHSETEVDAKKVNWRRTIEYYHDTATEVNDQTLVNKVDPYNANEKAEETLENAEFKVHIANHHNFLNKKSETDEGSANESESDGENETKVDTYYGNRSAYSSQAASIFFAGEEPEPSPRVRNVKLPDGVSDGDI